MTEITQADRDAAEQYDVVEAFARHREAAAAEERAKIVAWLRNNPDVYDWSPPTIAAAIIDEEHLDDRYQQGD